MRVAVAGFQHETNTFASLPADFAEFEKEDAWPGMLRGEEIVRVMTDRNIPMAGFVAAADPRDIVPLLWCAAEPCAPVTTDAFDRISGMIVDGLARAGAVDGLYLDLHGAMVTADHEDGEGELLRRVRTVVGDDLPIVVSLDLHANLSRAMVELSTGITAFRTYPHVDMAATGARACHLLGRILEAKHFTAAYRASPFLVPAVAQGTETEPGRSLYGLLPDMIRPGVANAELLMGFEAADVADAGPAVYACGTDDTAVAEAVERLHAALVAAEPIFGVRLYAPAEAVRAALNPARDGPVIVADVQDNSGGGAASDTIGMLEALVSERAPGAILGLINDPESAAAAHAAGEGATIELALGGKSADIAQKPFESRFTVERLGDGRFTFTGRNFGGSRAALGPMALLRVDGTDVRVAVGSKRCQCLDPDIFRHLGVEPADQRIVVVKSCVHFRADFESIAADILLAEAPGMTVCRVDRRQYRRLRPGVRLGPNGPVHMPPAHGATDDVLPQEA